MKGIVSQRPDPAFPPQPKVAYVAFPTLHDQPLTVAGQLRLPVGADGPVPAVVLVHGSSGVDGRGAALADSLNQGGMATLELDLWTPRGLAGGLARPDHPSETMPDAFGALRYLAAREDIDADRIGIAGFSWGGVVSMLSATRATVRDVVGEGGPRFAAHAPFYPVCWFYNVVPGYDFLDLTGAPVLLQAGALDTYDDPDSCTELVASLPEEDRRHVRVVVYPGATHAFDRMRPAITVRDPHAHKGAGGEVDFTPNPEVAREAHEATVAFFRGVFGLEP